MVLERYARGKESELIEEYIADGPTILKEKRGFTDDEWTVIFDYLVFDNNLLYKCVLQSLDFFTESYVKHGWAHVREVLAVEDEKYNEIWRPIFDFLAIANDGLCYHMMEHRDRYMVAFRARGGDFVRKVLGIWEDKYDESWEKILDILLHAVCDAIYTENTFERGLESFTRMVNGVRIHRPIEKSELFSRRVV